MEYARSGWREDDLDKTNPRRSVLSGLHFQDALVLGLKPTYLPTPLFAVSTVTYNGQDIIAGGEDSFISFTSARSHKKSHRGIHAKWTYTCHLEHHRNLLIASGYTETGFVRGHRLKMWSTESSQKRFDRPLPVNGTQCLDDSLFL